MRNERPQDLEREEAARALVQEKWKCIIHPLSPKTYPCDWAIFKDAKTFVGWAEYKYRGAEKWEKYPTTILSLSKWMTMKTLAQQSGRQFFLFFEWSDCIVYGRWPQYTGMGYPIAYGIELGGRDDRGQSEDREPVIAIPNREFKILVRGKPDQVAAGNAGVPASAPAVTREDRLAGGSQELADRNRSRARA